MTAPAKLSRATDYAGSEALSTALASRGKMIGEPMSVTVENLVKEFGVTPALHGVSLEIKGGELLALLGPFRLGQDDAAAPDCRARFSQSGPHPVRR